MNLMQLHRQREAIQHIAGRYGVENIRVFGSVARNEATPRSDVDLLVRVHKGTGLLKVVALEHALQEALGYKVQIISENGLSPLLRERILREAVLL